ncbi:BURP domain-containing protein 3-like [Bidens hawaiensis]|uniref:BURP domain-containing protein 3-like n=1 Tax=Bidens hawaiensis TaxID=980011 RepID=UPI00404B68FA
MRFSHLLGCYTLLSVALVGSDALSPEVYRKYVLPDTPMPKAIKESLITENPFRRRYDAPVSLENPFRCRYDAPVSLENPFRRRYDAPSSEDDQTNNLNDNPFLALAFLQNNLNQGAEMTLHFTNNNNLRSMLLPREIADSVPFSSTNIPQIYNHFLIKSNSMEAEDMKQMLKDCENKDNESEEVTYCATSLESMVDFATINLGKNVKAISTEVINGKESALSHKYKILSN